MRTLTITRKRAYAAFLAVLHIYIESEIPGCGELCVNGVMCRKLGSLKNGETKTFEIGDNPARIFAVFGNSDLSFTSDMVAIPAGTFNIHLEGRNYLIPKKGNPFIFDVNNCGEIATQLKQDSKKATKLFITMWAAIILTISSLVITFIFSSESGSDSSAASKAKEQVFTCGELSITLTDEFESRHPGDDVYESCDFAYDTDAISVFGIADSKTDMANYNVVTIEDYARLMLVVDELEGTEIKKQGGLVFYENVWEDPDYFDVYYYYTFLYSGNESFWYVQFVCDEEDAEYFRSDIMEWAGTVTFPASIDGVFLRLNTGTSSF